MIPVGTRILVYRRASYPLNGKSEYPETIQKKKLQYKNHYLFGRYRDLDETPEESDFESFANLLIIFIDFRNH